MEIDIVRVDCTVLADEPVESKMSVKIPPGDYILDLGAIVKVTKSNRKLWLVCGKLAPAEITNARLLASGWQIECFLFGRNFQGNLTKKPVIKPQTPA